MPRKVIFNNGPKFKRIFILLLRYLDVKLTCTSIKIHSQMLIWIEFTKSSVVCSRPKMWTKSRLTQFPHVLRFLHILCMKCNYHIIAHYKLPLGNYYLVTILLDINFQPNYKEMWLRKQKHIRYNNKYKNTKRVQYNYEISHYAYILRDGNLRKL